CCIQHKRLLSAEWRLPAPLGLPGGAGGEMKKGKFSPVCSIPRVFLAWVFRPGTAWARAWFF
ncbi:hypothetical protein L0G77_32050, partial [Pseudomonas aeruginosa]|uniref:hypothetical protein n=1 Tax=Pseudomonas aeruginosa TaxID=287 RepID=UPI001F484A7D